MCGVRVVEVVNMASVMYLACLAALLVAVAATPLPSDGSLADQVAPRRPAEGAVVLDEDLARKKNKANVTVGEEVLTAIVDGLTGESEDAKFGSDLREQFGILVQAVTKLGVNAINNYGAGNKKKPAAVREAGDCGQEAAAGCLESSGESSGESSSESSRSARAVDNVGEGRRRQVRRLLVRYLVLLKVFALGIILPGAVLLSLLQSWKAVTLSLMALLLAGVIGIRGLVNTAAKGQSAEVIHTTGPGGHYWRRVSSQEQGQEPDRLAYGAYVPVN